MQECHRREFGSRIPNRLGVDRARVTEAIRALGDAPRPPAAKKLSGRSAWRIRVGDYRVLYEVDDNRLVVLVVRIGHCRDVYRR